jgi:hypothetical protein
MYRTDHLLLEPDNVLLCLCELVITFHCVRLCFLE